MTHLMWKRDWEFSQASCDGCVKDTTYINTKLGKKKCQQCGTVTDL